MPRCRVKTSAGQRVTTRWWGCTFIIHWQSRVYEIVVKGLGKNAITTGPSDSDSARHICLPYEELLLLPSLLSLKLSVFLSLMLTPNVDVGFEKEEIFQDAEEVMQDKRHWVQIGRQSQNESYHRDHTRFPGTEHRWEDPSHKVAFIVFTCLPTISYNTLPSTQNTLTNYRASRGFSKFLDAFVIFTMQGFRWCRRGFTVSSRVSPTDCIMFNGALHHIHIIFLLLFYYFFGICKRSLLL